MVLVPRPFPALFVICFTCIKLIFLLLWKPSKVVRLRKLLILLKKLGFLSYDSVDAIGFAASIWCMRNSFRVTITIILKHHQVLHMNIIDNTNNSWFLSIVYGSPHRGSHCKLWQCLNNLGKSINGPWCVTGDFNAFIFDHEKNGGSKWTWCNNFIGAHFDMALVNAEWRCLFEDSLVVHPSNNLIIAHFGLEAIRTSFCLRRLDPSASLRLGLCMMTSRGL